MPVKSTSKEEEYFAQHELERRRKLALEREAQLAAEERKRLKELHWMRCPKCGMELEELDYRGTKIDTCGACRGVWLDAGEMESIASSEKESFLASFQKLFRG